MFSRLKGRVFEQMHAALLSAFTHAELRQLLRTELNARLDDITLNAQGLSDVVSAVISWAERRGRIAELLDHAVAARPGRPELGRVRDELGRRLKEGPGAKAKRARAQPPPTAQGPGARSAVPAGVLTWAQALAEASRSVCLLEVGDRATTAFAIAPRLVLCPHAVVAELIAGTGSASDITVTFGWSSPTEGSTGPSAWQLDRDVPIVDSDADLNVAVLLLGAPLPPDAVGSSLAAQFEAAVDGPAPVWPVRPLSAAPEPEDPLFVLTHVLGGPLTVEARFAIAHDDSGVTVSVDGPLRPGRVGAPVFDADFRAVAMYLGRSAPDAPAADAVRLAAVLNRPTVRLALAVSKPPPEPMSGVEMAF